MKNRPFILLTTTCTFVFILVLVAWFVYRSPSHPIVFLSFDDDLVTQIHQLDPNAASCTEPERMVIHGKDLGRVSEIKWLSDKKHLIYMPERESVWLMNADGTAHTQVVPPQPDFRGLWTAEMSPNQKHVALVKIHDDRDPNQNDLYIFDTETGGMRHLMDAVSGFTWSGDSRLAVENWRNGYFYVMQPNGQIEAEIKDVAMSNANLEWSPDSRQLALVSNEPNNPLSDEIKLVDVQTQRVTSLARAEPPYWRRTITSISWSPDGRKIVIVSIVDYGNQQGAVGEMFVVDVQTNQETRLAGNVDPTVFWSPDSHQITFASQGENRQKAQIYLADIRTKEIKQLTCSEEYKFSLTW